MNDLYCFCLIFLKSFTQLKTVQYMMNITNINYNGQMEEGGTANEKCCGNSKKDLQKVWKRYKKENKSCKRLARS